MSEEEAMMQAIAMSLAVEEETSDAPAEGLKVRLSNMSHLCVPLTCPSSRLTLSLK